MERAFWQHVVASDYAIPDGRAVADLTRELLDYLSSTDPQLRDNFGYEILATWISRQTYAPDQLRAIAAEMLARMRTGLGEQDTDGVFGRSFAVLMLAEVAYSDNERQFLDAAEVHAWLAATIDYLAHERDLRGFVPDKGWAHATAHTADLLAALAASRYLDASDLARLLEGVADKLTAPVAAVFLHDEDERLAAAVVNVLRRDVLECDALRRWLTRLLALGGADWRAAYLGEARAHPLHNTKSFLRSLYLQLVLGADPPPSASEVALLIADTLRAMDRGFYTRADE